MLPDGVTDVAGPGRDIARIDHLSRRLGTDYLNQRGEPRPSVGRRLLQRIKLAGLGLQRHDVVGSASRQRLERWLYSESELHVGHRLV